VAASPRVCGGGTGLGARVLGEDMKRGAVPVLQGPEAASACGPMARGAHGRDAARTRARVRLGATGGGG
jgi:hypothetical protein